LTRTATRAGNRVASLIAASSGDLARDSMLIRMPAATAWLQFGCVACRGRQS
jgi:hypothetical protein